VLGSIEGTSSISAAHAFRFVKGALVSIVNGYQLGQMSEGKFRDDLSA